MSGVAGAQHCTAEMASTTTTSPPCTPAGACRRRCRACPAVHRRCWESPRPPAPAKAAGRRPAGAPWRPLAFWRPSLAASSPCSLALSIGGAHAAPPYQPMCCSAAQRGRPCVRLVPAKVVDAHGAEGRAHFSMTHDVLPFEFGMHSRRPAYEKAVDRRSVPSVGTGCRWVPAL